MDNDLIFNNSFVFSWTLVALPLIGVFLWLLLGGELRVHYKTESNSVAFLINVTTKSITLELLLSAIYHLGLIFAGPFTGIWITVWYSWMTRGSIAERQQAAIIYRAKHYPKYYKANIPPPGQ